MKRDSDFLREDIKTEKIQKKIMDLQKLLEVSKAMTTIRDLDKLLSFIRDTAVELIECDRCTIFLVDKNSNELWARSVHGVEMHEIRFPVGIGIAGNVAVTGQAVNIPDAYADTRFNKEVDRKTGYRTRNMLTLPLFNYEEKIVGVMQVLNKREGAFSSYDEVVLAALGAQAAVMIENSQLVIEFLEKQKIKQSLEIAKGIQQSLLPESAPEIQGYDLAGYSESCDETGGDYYDFYELGDGRFGSVVGDVSGHGIGAALLMTTARAFMKALSKNMKDLPAMLADLNDMLEDDLEDEKFMTLFYGIVDPVKHEFLYSSCGHDEPQHYHAADGSFTEMDSTGMPLGILSGMDFPTGERLPLAPGDIVFICTDGIWEAPNEQNEQFGKERLRKVLRENADRPAGEIIQKVVQAVKTFIGTQERKDDLTMVVLRRLVK